MMLFERYYSTHNESDTRHVEGDADPEQLDLVRPHELGKRADAEDWQDVDEIVGTARYHCGGRGRSGYGKHFSARVFGVHRGFEVLVESNLDPEAGRKGREVVPKLDELALDERWSRDKRNDQKVRPKESGGCGRSPDNRLYNQAAHIIRVF